MRDWLRRHEHLLKALGYFAVAAFYVEYSVVYYEKLSWWWGIPVLGIVAVVGVAVLTVAVAVETRQEIRDSRSMGLWVLRVKRGPFHTQLEASPPFLVPPCVTGRHPHGLRSKRVADK